MVNLKTKKTGDLLLLANGLVLVILINLLAAKFFFRFDLTEEQRYSIKPQTKEILKQLDDDVFIEVYLEGELNAGFRRFRKSIRETLEEFRIYSRNKVHYKFVNPSEAMSEKARSEFMSELASKGIQPTNVIDNAGGQRVEKLIFPGALIAYGGAERGVMLLKGGGGTSDEKINRSIESVEFELVNALHTLTTSEAKRVGMVRGHQELDSLNVVALRSALQDVYDLSDVRLSSPQDLKVFDALIVAKPKGHFSDKDKFALDQYIIHGGKVLFLLDKLEASMDSASSENYFAFPYDLNLDDLLFRYGVRINMDLVQDRSAAFYPVVTGNVGGKPQMQLMDWPFFPLVNHYAQHPITTNLDAVTTKFVSSVDTVKATGIRKTPLLSSSQYARALTAPVNVNINDVLRRKVNPEEFTPGNIPVGYLLEGKFTSLYKNRFLPEGADSTGYRADGVASKLIVIGDGDLAANVVNPRNGQPQALGFDPFTSYTFANRELLMNAMAFLTDDNGLILSRNKEVKIRPLDKELVREDRLKWQIINLVLPLVLLIGYGVVRAVIRKKKLASF